MEACCSRSSSSFSSSVLPVHSSCCRSILQLRLAPAALHLPPSALRLSSCSVVAGRLLPLAFAPPHTARPHRRRGPVTAVFERFTERALKAVVSSQREARSLGDDAVRTHHLLLGLVAVDPSPLGFLDSGITLDRARDAVRALWATKPSPFPPSPPPPPPLPPPSVAAYLPFSASCKRAFEAAVDFSVGMGSNFVSPEHIAVGLFVADDGSAAQVLKSLGADPNHLASVAFSRLQGELMKDGRQSAASSEIIHAKPPARKAAHLKSFQKSQGKSALAQFCVDLNARAGDGLVDPVIGRDAEIQRIVQILGRRRKNNPILLGEQGVGKTAIAEGLALRITSGDVPIFLLEKRIMSLDVGLLIAGSKERGELEARLTGLLKEVNKAGDVILFIDEVHNLIGTGAVGRGNKGSGLDMANLLKPSLGRGELQCIASTTVDEHRTHFENDKAFARRFQPVFINEPSREDAVKILLGLREKYEIYHKCKYTLEAINAAVYLSARYIPDRHLPDKAIDLIDEAGSRARMDAFKRKKEEQASVLSRPPNEYWQEIRAVQAMHYAVPANKFKYSPNNSNNKNNNAVLDRKKGKPSISSAFHDKESVVVGAEEIAKVASLWSGIPVQHLTADETKLLLGLEQELRKHVIGQDDAIRTISRAVKRSRLGLSDPDRPISVLLFCGPTGVGKTELIKAFARSYFRSEEAVLRLDMSEYMERHAVSKLIGSPPGYIGYEDAGTLTEPVRRRPFSVILLKEIEKAHPSILNILLQIFEDGHLTDSQGRTASFKNTLIVMTSNIGSASIIKGRRGIGFFTAEDKNSSSYAAMKSIVMEELKSYFRPELLNRIDEVVVFRPLEKTQMLEIFKIMVQEVKSRLLSLGIHLELSDAVMDLVCKRGYEKSYGARSLRRAVTCLIEDVISEAILRRDCKPGDTIMLDVNSSGKTFVRQWPDQTIQLSDPTSTAI
ncbi:chaperone protein ClpD2, chloroplastic-like isoform X1 [Ananas comosus]|uniref:Chaperone protein ClpD2, chloroplastic-like isoform X1 n=1 Tax=Ananas comosus TaxID=4615 RepID=A0A6P5GTG4_ANACO|nr:chaperone protein ClpD2, chloroplastic-like isoform X1 [Ananas comosus]